MRRDRLIVWAATVVVASLVACGARRPVVPVPTVPTTQEDPVQDRAPVPSSSELLLRVRAALPKPGLDLRLSPVLPAHWPIAASGVEWLVYRTEALPTGIISYQVTGPVTRVTTRLPDGKPETESIDEGTAHGVDRGHGPDDPKLHAAEQALIAVAMGRRSPDEARADLTFYLDWAAASPVIGPDVRRRTPEFFAWIEAGQRGGGGK